MQNFDFKIASDNGEIYQVNFFIDDTIINATCTCMAGSMRQMCKHRMGLLKGEIDKVIDGKKNQVPILNQVIKEHKLGFIIYEIVDADKKVEYYKKLIKTGKKELAKIFNSKA